MQRASRAGRPHNRVRHARAHASCQVGGAGLGRRARIAEGSDYAKIIYDDAMPIRWASSHAQVTQVYFRMCTKVTSLWKPLTGTISQSESWKRGHGLVSETPTFGPSRPRYFTLLTSTFQPGLTRFGLPAREASPQWLWIL
jgi:hypothetical protein